MNKYLRKFREMGLLLPILHLVYIFIFINASIFTLEELSHCTRNTAYFILFMLFILYQIYRGTIAFYVKIRSGDIIHFCRKNKINYIEKMEPDELYAKDFTKITGAYKNVSKTLIHVMEVKYPECTIKCGIGTIDSDLYFDKMRLTHGSYKTFCIMKLPQIHSEHSSYSDVNSLSNPINPSFLRYQFRAAAKQIANLDVACEINKNVFLLRADYYLRGDSRYALINFMHELAIAFIKQTELHDLESTEKRREKLTGSRYLNTFPFNN